MYYVVIKGTESILYEAGTLTEARQFAKSYDDTVEIRNSDWKLIKSKVGK